VLSYRPTDITDGGAALAVAVMLVPATLGAILNWPWWVEYGLILPTVAWCIFTGRLVMYRQASHARFERRALPVAGCLPVLAAATVDPSRFSGLWIVLLFAIMLAVSGSRPSKSRTSASLPTR
jgi:hypothetical protein